jgi:hypothetical protein
MSGPRLSGVLGGALAAGLLSCALFLSAGGSGCGSDDDGNNNGGPDAGPEINFTHDDLVEACVRLSACNVERHPRLRDCILSYHNLSVELGLKKLYQRLYHCVNQGEGSCKVIRECVGYAGKPVSCDANYQEKCEGNVAYKCDLLVENGWEQQLDCSQGGLTCGTKDTGAGRMAAVCSPGACNKTLFEPMCQDNQLFSCVGGAIEIEDCGAKQLQCRDPSIAKCEGTGRSCRDSPDICKDHKIIRCVEGYLSEIDCTKMYGNKICDIATIECKGAGSECDEDGTFDDCQGDSLVVCVDGFTKTFDCKQMGFLGCEKATSYGAYCKAEPVYE